MRVQVKQAHIDAGIPRHASYCPIALALKEQTGELWTVTDDVAYPDKLTAPLGELPVQVREFILAFDTGEPVQPFEFELEEICVSS